MKKSKILALVALAGISTSIAYAKDVSNGIDGNLSPIGYWVQFDEESDAGHGKVQGVVQSYFAPNNDYGKKGSLEVKIVVPIMKISEDGKIAVPDIHGAMFGSGEKSGFKYDYTNPKTNLLQGLVVVGNNEKEPDTSSSTTSSVYGGGGALNPLDSKAYKSKLQVQDNGKTMYVRGYVGFGWFSIGKAAHWKRITKQQYLAVKAKCGLTKDGVYPYEDKNGKLVNEKLFKQCYNYNFGVDNPTK